MKSEIHAAVNLLCSYAQRFGSIKDELIERFRSQLEQTLFEHYQGHWYPEKPIKGQAYRSLEFNTENNYCDKIIARVCQCLSITPDLLGIRHELTLWVDPYEVTMRLGNHVCTKDNQQILVARFDQNGNELFHQSLDAILAQSRIPMINKSRLSPTNSSSSESQSNSGSSTPQRTSSPSNITSHSMFRNDPLFTPPRTLSPQAPVFQMFSSSPPFPMNVPLQHNALENSMNIDDYCTMEENYKQPDRSDTPQSMKSTTSNESSDSGYCGYVESYPYYYKLNRLYKALALQKFSSNSNSVHKNSHRRVPHHIHQQVNMAMPPNFSSSPQTPTPMNIDQLTPFFDEKPSYSASKLPIGSRKFKY